MRAHGRAALLALFLFSAPASAQPSGTLAAERLRLSQVTGDTVLRGEPRDSLRVRAVRAGVSIGGRVVLPSILTTYNSAIPYSLNDGAMWAGRGWAGSLTTGVELQLRRDNATLSLVLAPTFTYSQNRAFQTIPSETPERSSFASPFHAPGPLSSLDFPLRFGDEPLTRLHPGESVLALSVGSVTLGASTAPESWGPAIRNPLILSGNAAGVPRLFVKTADPVQTRVGRVSAGLLSGVLTESRFFDRDPANDYRSISGVVVEVIPAFDSTLMIGLERVVYSPIADDESLLLTSLTRPLDVFLRWEHIAAPGMNNPDGSPRQSADQILGLFMRKFLPTLGLEVYGEWARLDLPDSFTELFVGLHHTLAYSLGAQWASARSMRGRYLRLQTEFTNLEQSRVYPTRPPPDFYAGRVSAQGYTQRGQSIGAPIGPGSSSQWFALDYVTSRWQAGPYVTRIRWHNDALYRQPFYTLFNHDVTVAVGLRAALRTRLSDFAADLSLGQRYNYLFQNGVAHPSGFEFRTVDVRNASVTLSMSPR